MVIKISEQTITVEGAGKLVSNSVGQYALDYEFTDEYAPYDKFAVFAREDGSIDPVEVALNGQTGSVVIPWEVLRESGGLKIGAYGINGNLVRPTVWSKKLSIIEGAAPGDTAHQPTILPWEEIVRRIGDLNELETQDKSNLVAAINEAAQGGGGGTSDHAQLENRDAADQHPMSAITDLETVLDGKMEASALPNAIETALAQAKASGEFDGPKGDKGDTGATGAQGQQGIQGPRGEKGDTGEQGPKGDTGAAGPQGPAGANGQNGTDGYTPVKGTDYWTTSDKSEVVQEVLNEMDSETWTFTLDDDTTVTKQVVVKT